MPDDITERYPQLADLDGKDDDQRIEVFRDVLGQLQRELDEPLKDKTAGRETTGCERCRNGTS